MAIHMTERRMGEIGVRKTLGASAAKVLAMLLKDFSTPVLIANLLVWPLAFVATGLLQSLHATSFAHSVALHREPCDCTRCRLACRHRAGRARGKDEAGGGVAL